MQDGAKTAEEYQEYTVPSRAAPNERFLTAYYAAKPESSYL